jgi:ADP-ribose pyrophosphatase YjhB (NUDIX family)
MSHGPDDAAAERPFEGESPPNPELRRVTRLAAYGVVWRDDRILLCRVAPGNLGEGLWTLPGGGLDFGEAPETGALREVAEETGLEARIVGAPSIHSDAGIWTRRSGDVSYHHIRFVYPMEAVAGEERVEVGGSTDGYGWFSRSEAATLPIGDLVERELAKP